MSTPAKVTVEWGVRGPSGAVWGVPRAVAVVTDPQRWAETRAAAEGGEVVSRTVTVSDWVAPVDSAAAQVWREAAVIEEPRRFIWAVKQLRSSEGLSLCEAKSALDAYLASVGEGR